MGVAGASSAEKCVQREQRAYASPEFRTQREMLKSFVLKIGERDQRQKRWPKRVLLLFCGLVKGELDGNDRAFVLYMQFMAPSNEVYEALECVCLRWAVSDSEEREDDVRKGGNSTELVLADEGLQVTPFQITVSTVHTVQANIALHRFTTKLA